jgi:hypothetical protein
LPHYGSIPRSYHSLSNRIDASLLRTLQTDGAEYQSLLGNRYAVDATELRWLLYNLPEKDRATGHRDVQTLSCLHILIVGKHSRNLLLVAENRRSAHIDEHSAVLPRIRPVQGQEP